MSERQFFDLVELLDSLLQGSPSDEQCLSQVIELIGDSELRKYFFDHLQDPQWIGPLSERGLFTVSPEAEFDHNGHATFSPWPQSRYLTRMAIQAPSAVLEIAFKIALTENPFIHEDLTDAALAMPASMAATWAKSEVRWIGSQTQIFPHHARKLGSLITYIAKGGEIEAALELARILLAVLPDPTVKEEQAKAETSLLPPEPRPRFHLWHYEQILKETFPEFVMTVGLPTLDVLCPCLEAAIRLSRRREDDEGPEDYSYIWRPAIEDDAQNSSHGLKDILVLSVRDTAELLAQSGSAKVTDLVEVLEQPRWQWLVFRRIALHLLGQFPHAAPNLVATRLTSHELFDDSRMRHEYARLAEKQFAALTLEQQQLILSWIEKGPNLQRFRNAEEQFAGKPPTHEHTIQYRKIWQRDRLAWFRASLPKNWKRRYETLVDELGEPEHPDFSSYTASWIGPTSPESAEKLQTMSVADIIKLLRSWEPSNEHMSASAEGLGRELTSVVTQNPGRFASEAKCFQGLRLTYVRSFLYGLREALKQKAAFEWSPVFDLSRWLVGQPDDIAGNRQQVAAAEGERSSTREAVAELLSAGFTEGVGSIPFSERSTVWEILWPLTRDPNPTAEYETNYGGANLEPATLSINTTRGEAMHTVVRYALWVRRNLEKLPDAKERLVRGFDEMAEVREVLQEHLDVSRDSSLAIRAVYGQWFPWLVLLDPAWAKAHAAQVFPVNPSERLFRAAAWETYLTFCAPYDNVLDVLPEQYTFAVEHLGTIVEGLRRSVDPDERLAEHLMTFYWRGKLRLDDSEGLLAKFLGKASDTLRGHALEFIGRSIHNTKEAIAHEILERLQNLWESRLVAAKTSEGSKTHQAEMAAFGWWFISGKYEGHWAITQLKEALRIGGKTDPDQMVIEHLAELAPTIPSETVQCVEAMMKNEHEGWRISGWRNHAWTILASAIRSPDREAAYIAKRLVNDFGRKGYWEFRELLLLQ